MQHPYGYMSCVRRSQFWGDYRWWTKQQQQKTRMIEKCWFFIFVSHPNPVAFSKRRHNCKRKSVFPTPNYKNRFHFVNERCFQLFNELCKLEKKEKEYRFLENKLYICVCACIYIHIHTREHTYSDVANVYIRCNCTCSGCLSRQNIGMQLWRRQALNLICMFMHLTFHA